MSLHTGSVEIRIEKAKPQPDIVVAIAEAIDMATTGASPVTTPVLDARVLKAQGLCALTQVTHLGVLGIGEDLSMECKYSGTVDEGTNT